ncbi:MAG TPA: hypothetical protein VEX38_01840 [Fimbriimonadaceae bacterium]|nr:hypothetical protein [Fimbriimonadaceae bacterium]
MFAPLPTPPIGQTVPAPVSGNPSRKTLYAVLITLGVAIVAILGLSAAGVLRFGGKTPDNSALRVDGGAGGKTLVATGDAPQPSLRVEGEQVEMPADVRAWLEHLKLTEEKRNELAQSQINELMIVGQEVQGANALSILQGMLDEEVETGQEPKSPTVVKVSQTAEQLRAGWTDLTQFFNSKAPPAECIPIRNEYDQALRETGATVVDILGIMAEMGQNAREALPRLQEISRTHKERIDKPAMNTDRLVQAICDKYKTRKWFSVKGDIGSSGLFGSSGF